MSLYASLVTGVSGLNAFSTSMGVISDNITNVNTVGYKDSESKFSTLVTQSSSTTYSPGGVSADVVSNVSTQGLLTRTNNDTDLSIDGAGFFVTKDEPTSGNSGIISFTRAGSFTPDNQGFFRNVANQYILGWRLEPDGSVINNGTTDLLEPITTAGLTGAASPTTIVRMNANISSTTPVSPLEATYNPAVAATNMASGTVPADFSRDVQVFDAEGNTHVVRYSFLKSAVDDQWNLEIHVVPETDVNTAPGLVNGQLAVGTVSFQDGVIDLVNSSASLQTPITINWAGNVSDSVITFDLGDSTLRTGLTQYASESAEESTFVDGAIFGAVTGITINDGGTVTATFDNGLSQDIYRLALATFQNPDGLRRQQGNTYGVTNESGSFTLVEAGTGGSGNVEPGTLEASTVDLAREFSNMITTQRAYSASTRVITTADEMLAELNSIKR
ncbi:MAG: flagellar hook protein FlgE [Pseudomonadota bacterium]